MSSTFSHGYALLIGVGQSIYTPWSLPVTVQDAQALHTALSDPMRCAYPAGENHIRVLYDANATRDAILQGVDWLAAQVAADGDATAMLFYSGHGWCDQAGAY